MWKYICVAWFVWANTYVSFIFPLIFRMHIRVLSYSLLTVLPWPTENLFYSEAVSRSSLARCSKRLGSNTAESVPTVAFEPEAAQKQLFEPEAAQKQLEADPPLAWPKKPKNPKSSPKLRRNAKFEPNAAKDPKMKQKWQTELTFKSWK